MFTDILAFALLAVGAFISYKADYVYKKIKGSDADEKQVIFLKSAGLLIVIVGLLIIFYI
ncbi:MAG: hypothetical protein AB7G87_10480 [Clostridia bacterium]